MQFKQSLLLRGRFKIAIISIFFIPAVAFSQTTYLPQDSREYLILERLEIMNQKDSLLNFSKLKPYRRKDLATAIRRYAYFEKYGQMDSAGRKEFLLDLMAYSTADRYNLTNAILRNTEWFADSIISRSRKPFLKKFYRSPYHFYEVHEKDFFLAVDPVLQYYVAKEKNNDQHLFLNTRGITLRGRIANKIGFSAYVTDNQERTPLYVQQWEDERRAVPGAGFYKSFKQTGYDYFDARGYITFNAAKYIDVQFGYDKNFIGNGYRSLFLSDFSAPTLFLKLNTRIWKFNYQNLFMELNTANRLNADRLIPKKYAALHHLDLAVTRWLNIGFFEGVIFGRSDHFEFGYLNPVIFYRSIEQQSGSFDNAVMGVDAKANVAGKFQFYGQFLLDEFNLTQLRKGSGWWANKIGYQIGGKYIDAFSIRNLDLQLEYNHVRPFTYSHRDSIANYTHYNQPLAHPLGAGFRELLGMVRYQPIPKLYMEAKAIYYMQGRDTGQVNFGNNIFLPSRPPYRTMDYGFEIGDPDKRKTALASLLVSYEIKPGLYVEGTALFRKQSATTTEPSNNTMVIFAGVRWNMHRRNFDF